MSNTPGTVDDTDRAYTEGGEAMKDRVLDEIADVREDVDFEDRDGWGCEEVTTLLD